MSKFPTFTWKDNVLIWCAEIDTLIPSAKSDSLLSIVKPSKVMFPANVVPVGTVSFTSTLVGAVPLLLSNLIVYVIMSPSFTSVPGCGLDSLLAITFGLFTVFVTVFVSTSFTFAVFVISFSNTFSSNSLTVTSKLKVVCPKAGTSTSIPSFRLLSVYATFCASFIFTLSGTNVVPSGIKSLIVAFPAKLPLFSTVMQYVIVSPSTA